MDQTSLFDNDFDCPISLIWPILEQVTLDNWLDTKFLAVEEKKKIYSLRFNDAVFAHISKGSSKKIIEVAKLTSFSQTAFDSYELEEWSDILNYADSFAAALQRTIDSLPKGFACCSRYEQCSDLMRCCSPFPEFRLECGYRKILKSGHSFYGKNPH